MLLRIDPGSAQPLHEQVAAQLRRAIGEGRLRDGEQLDPARTLAALLNINMHTVLRAYAALRDEGLVEMRRGRGVTIRATDGGRARVVERARELLSEARRQGLKLSEIKNLLEDLS